MELLPPSLRASLYAVEEETAREATEIRLRVGTPVSLTVRGKAVYPKKAPPLQKQEAEDFFLRLCDGAVYAHRDEIAAGFLTAAGGYRVGIGGRAVTQNGVITSLTDISFFNIRLPRPHRGVSRKLMPYLWGEQGIYSALLFGPPLSGKTTLLRDVASSFASRSITVAVIDERRELFDTPSPCLDVFSGYPRRQGIEQAIRLFSPALLIFDELGSEADVDCLRLAAGTGVPVIATAHAPTFSALRSRRLLADAVNGGFFQRFVGLSGGENTGKITGIYREDGEKIETVFVDDGDGGMHSSRAGKSLALHRTG